MLSRYRKRELFLLQIVADVCNLRCKNSVDGEWRQEKNLIFCIGYLIYASLAVELFKRL